MNTKEQVEQCIKSLHWLMFCIVGEQEPKKNTFEFATKTYLENAISLLKGSIESSEILGIIFNHFDFDAAIRYGNNQPMLKITNKRTNEYWELPITKNEYDLILRGAIK